MEKYAIYTRVSTREQTTDNQVKILLERAKREGWDYELFEEQESTRKTRPVKNQLMTRLRNKEFSHVVVLKLDRWARGMKELTDDILELQKREIMFISVRENIDLSTPTGKLQFNIICSFAEFERDLIRERTLDGLARAKSNGIKLGRPAGSKDKKVRSKAGYHLRNYNTPEAIRNRKNNKAYKDRKKIEAANKVNSEENK